MSVCVFFKVKDCDVVYDVGIVDSLQIGCWQKVDGKIFVDFWIQKRVLGCKCIIRSDRGIVLGFVFFVICGCGGVQIVRLIIQEVVVMVGYLVVFLFIGFEQECELMKGFMGGVDFKRWYFLVGVFYLVWFVIFLIGVV